MSGRKRNKATKANHRSRIAELRLRSTPIAQIASALRISVPTVKRELRALAAEWRAEAAKDTEAHRQIELKKLDLIEQEAFAEWERSKKNYAKEVTERMKMPGRGEGDEDLETEAKVIKREEGGRLGDPRLLQIALNAQERRSKLLGMEAPVKVAPTDPTGEKPFRSMSDEELTQRIIELQAKAA